MKEYLVSQLQKELTSLNVGNTLRQILEHEKSHRGVDWQAFYSGEGAQDVHVARVLASFNLKGDIDLLRKDPAAFLAVNTDDEVKTNANLHIANTEEEGRMIDYLQGLRGNAMKTYVTYLTQKLQLAETHTSSTTIAVEVGGAGILAIGGLWLKGTIQALRAGKALLAACAAGVSSLGITAAITAIGILIIVVLIPFLIFMDKKAEMLALILNRTPKNIRMSYYFRHGKLVSEPSELLVTAQRWVSTAGNQKVGNDEISAAGLLLVSKRDYALIGVEGACKLEFEGGCSAFPNGVYVGFSVPLASGDNKCYISRDAYSGAENFFDQNYDNFQLETSKDENTRMIQVRMDRADGGEPVLVAIVQAK